MEEKDYSVNTLINFLEHASAKGLLKFNTARTRKTAVKRLVEFFDERSRRDIRDVDIERVMDKFAAKSGNDVVNIKTLKTYKIRFKRSVEDFLSWQKDPDGFKAREKNASKGGGSLNCQETNVTGHGLVFNSIRFPIPLRTGVIVYIENLPQDMTYEEAEKISAVIKALAK